MLSTLGHLPTEMWRENRSREILWSWVSWGTHGCSVLVFSSWPEHGTNRAAEKLNHQAAVSGATAEKSTHCCIYQSKQLDRNLSSWEIIGTKRKIFISMFLLPLVFTLSPGAQNSSLWQTKRQPCMSACCKGAQRNPPVHFPSHRWSCGCFVFICLLWVPSVCLSMV